MSRGASVSSRPLQARCRCAPRLGQQPRPGRIRVARPRVIFPDETAPISSPMKAKGISELAFVAHRCRFERALRRHRRTGA